MDYPEAIRYLYGLTRFGIKLGLDNTRRLAAIAGNPHERLRFIHVAGTNGKGTTCSMLESVYREAGLKVGLYTSPHLISFRERIQVNRELISEAEIVRLVNELRSLVDGEADFKPTFFEFVTVMGMTWFAEQECELVILETGLGGRFDSTNIVTPLVSVITRIGLDHQDILGESLEKIAGEKAGIIKPGVPVVRAEQEPVAASVIDRTADELGATVAVPRSCPDLTGGLIGAHNRQNAELAAQVTDTLRDEIRISDEAIAAGLAGYEWPGRLQIVERDGQRFVLDGAHNEDGFVALGFALEEFSAGQQPALILGILGDKDADAIAGEIKLRYGKVLVVPIASKRAGDTQQLAAKLGGKGVDSLEQALGECASEPDVVIAGSFYLIGEALEQLGAVPTGLRSERELNEWGR